MQFTPQKGILVDKPLTVWFFFERDCPICAFVKRYVLRPMSFQGMIKLEPYEIQANITSPAVKWFYDYSNYEMGGDVQISSALQNEIMMLITFLYNGALRLCTIKGVLHTKIDFSHYCNAFHNMILYCFNHKLIVPIKAKKINGVEKI